MQEHNNVAAMTSGRRATHWRPTAAPHSAIVWMLACVVVTVPPRTAFSQIEPAGAVAIDADAGDRLESMSRYLGKLDGFHFTADLHYDDFTVGGQKQERTGRLSVELRRPDRFRVHLDTDKAELGMWYDGQRFYMLDHDRLVYAGVGMPGTIDAALDALVNDYGVAIPAADVLFSKPFEAMTARVVSGCVLSGDQASADAPDHLQFLQELIDWEIWIDKGDRPLPRRLRITYGDLPGQPRYDIRFVEWQTDGHGDDADFRFSPPAGGHRTWLVPLSGSESRAVDEEREGGVKPVKR